MTDDRDPRDEVRALAGLRAAGIAVIALALLFAFLLYGRRESRNEPAAQRIAVGQAGSSPNAQAPMSPREAADEVFNQAMTAVEEHDTANAKRLVPMALAAYRGLSDLDPDGHYHVALLELAAGQPAEARAEADTILEAFPKHLLALYVAAEAERALGRPDRAAALYRRYLDAYDPDSLGTRPEYLQHQPVLPRAAEEARAFLRTTGG